MLISRKILEIVSLNVCLHKKIVKLSYGTYFKVDFTNNSWNCYSTCVRTKKSLNRITDLLQSWFDGKFLKLWTLGHFRFEGKFKVLASGLSSSLLSTPPIEVLPLVGKFCRKLIQIVKKGSNCNTYSLDSICPPPSENVLHPENGSDRDKVLVRLGLL